MDEPRYALESISGAGAYAVFDHKERRYVTKQESCDAMNQLTAVTAERDEALAFLAEAQRLLNNLLKFSLSDQEARLLMVIAAGEAMSNSRNEVGQLNHARCDKIAAAREAARAFLTVPPRRDTGRMETIP